MSEFKTVQMTKDASGSPDGITVIQYKKGERYDLPEDLANVFCKQLKCAKASRRKPVQETPEANGKAGPNETPESPR